jgi:uncharacterized membrane protein
VSPLAAAIDRAVDAVATNRRLDAVADRVRVAVDAVPESVRHGIGGDWLGIPLHPVLTDVTIGAWTGSFVADLVGGRDARAFSRRLLLIGNLSAFPTMATGLADWGALDPAARRLGLVHAATNIGATALYLRSYGARRRGHHAAGVTWGLIAATVATVGGHLGGILAYHAPEGDGDDAPEPTRAAEPGVATPFASESLRIG